ncbi:hypothetical protein B0H13DRAFT_2153579 [Mycena leptocephala]|nr:hypothetical protein B0H13DRAFT_2153579 [Mycena leptocephala]
MCATKIRPTELRTVQALSTQSVQTKMRGKIRRTTRENRRMSECIPSVLLTPTLVLVHAALPRWVAHGHRHSKSRASGVHGEKKSLEGEFEASNNLSQRDLGGLLRMGARRTENDHGETIGTAILRNLISFRITAMLSSGEGFGPRGRRVHWVRLDLVGVSSHCRGWWESQADSWSRPVLILTRRWMACRTLT